MATSKKKVCGSCKGCGHDKGGRPLIRRETIKTPEGVRSKHVTVKQGSGCTTCLGVGVISLNGGW